MKASEKTSLTRRIDLIRDGRLAYGFADAVTGKRWQCDAQSQSKWTALGASALAVIVQDNGSAPPFELIAADNSQASLTAAETLALTNDRLLPWVSATMLYARQLKDAVLAGDPPDDLFAGWP